MKNQFIQKIVAISIALIISVYATGLAVAESTNNVNVTNEYRVVGLSEGTTKGNVGIGRMFQLCQETYGPQARMCTTEEVVRSPNIVGLLELGESGWVQPVIAAIMLDQDGKFQVRDVTGISVTFDSRLRPEGLSCGQWGQSSGYGGASLIRSDQNDQGIDTTFLWHQNCGSNINVLCCAPNYTKRKFKNYRDKDD